MKRFVMLASIVSALALCAVGAASVGTGSWGSWEPTYQGPIVAPAGAVCAFPVSAEPVSQNLRLRYHFDEAGNADGYEVVGPLVARITNTATGASIERNLASKGTVLFAEDGSWEAVVDGNFLIFFTAQDNPSTELLLLAGRTVLRGTATGAKTLVSANGRSEDVCAALS